MTKMIRTAGLAMALFVATTGAALATPSTQVWIPSTDVQAFGTAHLNFDTYIRTSKNGPVSNNYIVAGPTVGVLPFEKVQAEVGFDYIDGGTSSGTDQSPIYFHGKLGTPEGSLFNHSPAIAVGIYNMGTKTGGTAMTKQNIAYGLLAKTIPVVGRISAGGYHGSSTVLLDENGKSANDGVMLSWDRTMSEISDKLWVAVDYMSGKNANGALNFGVSWAFAKNVSVIFGYDIYNNAMTGGKNTFTTQVDINFP
ncbi:hypothetical protein [Geomobilimonas luticola]|uniref:Uncharacterized protein n=1 Tax=Geomobilimonas luticola TaxID=1114878 RepID=A0ABS5SG35_9BACT|nr:hypothetical protein [Geomobilimonas luticola]MBT0653566.1 hypothetical protein [Geomobilimonas luticola]